MKNSVSTTNIQFYLVGGAVRNLLLYFFKDFKVFKGFNKFDIFNGFENTIDKNQSTQSNLVNQGNQPNLLEHLNQLNHLDTAEQIKKIEKILQSDLDILVVGAEPKLFESKGFSAVGTDFPVFLHPDHHLEYALARTERKNGRGYHGFAFYAAPDVTIEQDLMRRDFTINSMALPLEMDEKFQPIDLSIQLINIWQKWAQSDINQNKSASDLQKLPILIDPYHGQQDLINKILKHISQHFCEDPLRILRLARFAAQYDLDVDQSTIQLIQTSNLCQELNTISAERFYQEWQKALNLNFKNNFVKFLTTLEQVGALSFLYDVDHLNIIDQLSDYLKKNSKRLCLAQGFLQNLQKIHHSNCFKHITERTECTELTEHKTIIQNINLAWPIFDYLHYILDLNQDLKKDSCLSINMDMGISQNQFHIHNLPHINSALLIICKRLSLPKKIEKNLQLYLKSSVTAKVILNFLQNKSAYKAAYFEVCECFLILLNDFNVWHQPHELEHLCIFLKLLNFINDIDLKNEIAGDLINQFAECLYQAANIQAREVLQEQPNLKGIEIQQALFNKRLKFMQQAVFGFNIEAT